MMRNRSAPPATVCPVLVVPDVRAAVAWLDRAFGFRERVRVGESHRAHLQVGDEGAIILTDAHGEQQPPNAGPVTHVIRVRVPDADAAFARARAAGAATLQEPTTHPFGERSCKLRDPTGHVWELAQTLRDVAPTEWGGEGGW